MEPTSLILSPA